MQASLFSAHSVPRKYNDNFLALSQTGRTAVKGWHRYEVELDDTIRFSWQTTKESDLNGNTDGYFKALIISLHAYCTLLIILLFKSITS